MLPLFRTQKIESNMTEYYFALASFVIDAYIRRYNYSLSQFQSNHKPRSGFHFLKKC